MKEVLSSAAEAEVAGLFHNGKEACPIRTALEEMGYPQPATPIVTDNSTASGIANDTVKQKRSKAMDMRYYWIRDRVRQGQFIVFWRKGKLNKADYFTKHHPASHHRAIRSTYIHDKTSHNSSQNYFDVLMDEEEDIDSPQESADTPASVRGEGVFKSPNTSPGTHSPQTGGTAHADARPTAISPNRCTPQSISS